MSKGNPAKPEELWGIADFSVIPMGIGASVSLSKKKFTHFPTNTCYDSNWISMA